MTQHLSGKVAIVTGGGRGIGRAIATHAASEGAAVVVCDLFARDDGVAAAEAVAHEIIQAGGRAAPCVADIAQEAGGDATAATALEQFGRVDMLVNCAGNNVRAPFTEMTREQWDSVMDVHVNGHFHCTRAAVRAILEHGGGGRIVNFASRGAFFTVPPPPPGGEAKAHRLPSVVYSAAKAAILGMTSTLALELAPANITVNAIIPSADTQLFPGKGARGSGGVPATISLDPDYIAPFVAFLGTEDASAITGRFVYVTGGDVCFYGQPLALSGARFVRKFGKWNVDELIETIPSIASAQ